MSGREQDQELREELTRRQAESEERQTLLNRWMDTVKEAEARVAAVEAERDGIAKQIAEMRQQTTGFEDQLATLQRQNRELQEQCRALALEREQALSRCGGQEDQITALRQALATRLTTRILRKLRRS